MTKFCPLTKEPCHADCAWYHEFDEECAVSIIAYVAVAEYNENADEQELQDNLHKDIKDELPN